MQWRDDNSPVAARRVTSSEFGRWRSSAPDATFIYDKLVQQPMAEWFSGGIAGSVIQARDITIAAPVPVLPPVGEVSAGGLAAAPGAGVRRPRRVLGELGRVLQAGPGVITQAVVGLGGVGKSELALQYAHRHQGEYRLVWWLLAETPDDVQAGLAELCRALCTPLASAAAAEAPAQEAAAWAVAWLAAHEPVAGGVRQRRRPRRPATAPRPVALRARAGDQPPHHRLGPSRHSPAATGPGPGRRRRSTDTHHPGRDPRSGSVPTRPEVERADAALCDPGGRSGGGAGGRVGWVAAGVAAGRRLHRRHPRRRPRPPIWSCCAVPRHWAMAASPAHHPDPAEGAAGGRRRSDEQVVAGVWAVTIGRIRQIRPLAVRVLRLLACYAPDRLPCSAVRPARQRPHRGR